MNALLLFIKFKFFLDFIFILSKKFLKEELLRSSHPNAGSIRAKTSDLNQLWLEVNDAANDRQQALLDGKNIHVFDQKADDLLNRLAEQEAYIVALDSEDLTIVDFATVKAFVQKHEDFLHALYVLEKQVILFYFFLKYN